MRLKTIKLAGFKTFVDPITIPLSAGRVAIVGPNGCGKSNIIDAIRCVLGENSAKYLRGEAIVDMIFNGSSGRKPVGQASIELVFDNCDNRLGGAYAAYSEISIKRQISRDGQSYYSLNGSRCRRRDIIDIFLGTGLGPRNYAIIEQDTTLLAEAKPEVLRAAIEETAGISRYKERRHETELRIEHTRENLARLSDLRQEIEKQLSHLQKQANAASRYTDLKEKERTLRTQLFNSRANSLKAQLESYAEHVHTIETEFTTANTQNIVFENSIQMLREQLQKTQQTFSDQQATLHRIEIDLTKTIQTRQHQADRRTKLMREQAQAINLLKEAEQQTFADQTLMQQMVKQLDEIQITRIEADQANNTAQKEEHTLKLILQTWQGRWDDFQKKSSETQRQIDVEQMRIPQLEARLSTLLQQLHRLQEESNLLQQQVEKDQNNFVDQLEVFQTQIQTLEKQIEIINASINRHRSLHQGFENETKQLQQKNQSLRESFASLNALQQVALGQGQQNSTHIEWLKTHELFEKPRLAQLLQVTEGWEHAIEVVLNFYLESICLDSQTDFSSQLLHTLPEADFCLLSPLKNTTQVFINNPRLNLPPLTSHIKTPWSLGYLLSDVYVTDNLTEAFALRDQLKAHESIVTREGAWLGPNWLRIQRNSGEKVGLIQRERELVELKEKIAAIQVELNSQTQLLTENLNQLTLEETEKKQLQEQLTTLKNQQAEIRGQWQAQQLECHRASKRLQEIQQQLTTSHAEQKQHEEAIEAAKKTLQKALLEMEEQLEVRHDFLQQREIHQTALDTKTQEAQKLRQKSHELALQIESLRSQINATQQHAERFQKQLEMQRSQLTAIESELHQPLENDHLQEELTQLEALQTCAQEALASTKNELELLHQQENTFTAEKIASDRAIKLLRDQLENQRLSQKAVEERFAGLQLQMQEFGCLNSQDHQESLENPIDESALEKQLEQTQSRILNLGAINLAAIDELQEQQTRKNYLTEQNNDLEEALKTLENAIRQIDDETRHRFKETFDAINAHFEKLFPRLFGGGQAKLTLTEDNWLTAGVQVFAQPPGKRNSTIHLLSGGEKALTAIALVFSLFQLNPAPFCILDEIDAPLDDANVGRFCELVKEMSEHIQFIFVTHNKVAMEMAQHLIGVTANEPGISRLVAVDVEQAIRMVEHTKELSEV